MDVLCGAFRASKSHVKSGAVNFQITLLCAEHVHVQWTCDNYQLVPTKWFYTFNSFAHIYL